MLKQKIIFYLNTLKENLKSSIEKLRILRKVINTPPKTLDINVIENILYKLEVRIKRHNFE